MDDTIEVMATHNGTMEGVVPSQDGKPMAGKKKKKKKTKHTSLTTELPPLRQLPNVALELQQLSGMRYVVWTLISMEYVNTIKVGTPPSTTFIPTCALECF